MNDYMHVAYQGTTTKKYLIGDSRLMINSKHKMNWIHKLAYKYLTKVGVIVPNMAEQVKYETFTINKNELLKNLHAQIGDIYQITNSRNNRVLMGYDEFQRMVDSPELNRNHVFAFDMNASYDSIMGMKIEVIPWMSGILVIPNDKGQK